MSVLPEEFEWDEGNEEKNWRKHKVATKESEEVFANTPLFMFPDPRHSQKEERFVAYGRTKTGRHLTLVFTKRENRIRVISARDQNKNERRYYDQNTN